MECAIPVGTYAVRTWVQRRERCHVVIQGEMWKRLIKKLRQRAKGDGKSNKISSKNLTVARIVRAEKKRLASGGVGAERPE